MVSTKNGGINMRNIKFRAWNMQENRMMEWQELRNEIAILTDVLENFYPYCKPVMQYTGIKDNNKKEIYEGDLVQIVGNEEDGLFKVVWSNKDSMYMLKDANKSFEKLCEYEYIVKGNIYENSYLLEC